MASEKSFPPSELRRERLRKEGVVPVSPEGVSAGALIGSAIGLWWVWRGELQGWEEFFREVFSGGFVEPSSVALKMSAILFSSAAKLALPPIAGAILFMVLQNRFVFIARRVRVTRRNRQERSTVLSLVSWGCILGGAFLLVVPTLEAGIATDRREELRIVLSGGETDGVFRVFGALTSRMILGMGCMAGIVGAFGVFLARLRFRRVYSMSRGELEAEARESEMRPELKGAIREIFHGTE